MPSFLITRIFRELFKNYIFPFSLKYNSILAIMSISQPRTWCNTAQSADTGAFCVF